jgi:endogenous inhibitor of DNA gyrase (YacG/DUF329 family)
MSNGVRAPSAGVELCPTCRRPAADAFRPFCSRRCADVDLHRWLSGAYAIPVREEEDEDGNQTTEDRGQMSEGR